TYYGIDNQIDGVVLDVLLRKHKTIRSSLGISVPVPGNTNEVVQALMQGLMLRGHRTGPKDQLSFMDMSDDFSREMYRELYTQWDNVTEREKRSRTMFAQRSIDVTDVAREWELTRAAIGAGVDVERFTTHAVKAHGGFVTAKHNYVELRLPNQSALREAVGGVETLAARFALPVGDGVTYLSRTHPFVEGLAATIMDAALDPLLDSPAKRCGAIRTHAVQTRTTLLLLRLRHHIITSAGGVTNQLLAEECVVTGFTGAPANAFWLSEAEAEDLLQAEPAGNILPQQASNFVSQVVEGIGRVRTALDQLAVERAYELLDAHRRVRTTDRRTGVRYDVQAQLPVDVLGIYVLLPTVS
ncbi:MAG: hypothetical protein KDD83_16115, partial [Caldilineaceae bacterium]|nr:hypothetical protein [Caldilineaceae bacterium]